MHFVNPESTQRHKLVQAASNWVGLVQKHAKGPDETWRKIQHGIFHYGLGVMQQVPMYRQLQMTNDSFLSRFIPPLARLELPELGTLKDLSAEQMRKLIGQHSPGLNVHHGAQFRETKDMYRELLKFVFFQKALNKKKLGKTEEFSNLELEAMKTQYNQTFGEYVHAPKFLDLLHAHIDRRKMPAQTIPFDDKGKTRAQKLRAADLWARKVVGQLSDPHDALRMLKHGELHYGKKIMAQSQAYLKAHGKVHPQLSEEQQIHYRHSRME